MKKNGLQWLALWLAGFLAILIILVVPGSRHAFMDFTKVHPYLGGFIKFFVLATVGELLAIRIATGSWSVPRGIFYKALIWGFLGIVIVLIFDLFSGGVAASMKKGMLPGGDMKFAFAFLTSAIMNLTFAPVMMAFHRFTDTYIDLKYENKGQRISVSRVVNTIDWDGFISFVVIKTIPIFWIPAHTITFLLPPEYRVLVAAFLSLALGAILAFAKKNSRKAKA